MRDNIVPSRKWVAYHSTARAGVYLYGNNATGKDYWNEEEVVEHWPLSCDMDHVADCEPQSEEEEAILQQFPCEIKDWMDLRGDAI